MDVNGHEWDPSGKVFTEECVLRAQRTHVREKICEPKEYQSTFGNNSACAVSMPSYTAEADKENHQDGETLACVSNSYSHMSIGLKRNPLNVKNVRNPAFFIHSFQRHMEIYTGEKPYGM